MDMSAETPPENVKARLKESYDAIAPTYNAWTTRHSPFRLAYLDKMLELLPAAAEGVELSVLELGCGAGVPVTEKLLTVPNITAITANDMSSVQIALAKEALGSDRIDWREGDMMSLEFGAGSFDAVLGLYSIIHLPRDEQAELFGRIATWLRPGGCFLATFGVEEMHGAVMGHWLHEKGWMYWSAFGEEKTLEKLKAVGMEIVVSKEEPELGTNGTTLWVLAKKSK